MNQQQQSIHVAFATNSKGKLPLSVALWSVLEQAAEQTTVHVHLLCDQVPEAMCAELSALVQRAGARHTLSFYHVEKYMTEELIMTPEWPRVAWARIYLAEFLPEVPRVIYLDIDTLACRDLAELYTTEMNGGALGVVLEHESHVGSHFNERLEIPQECPGYFNSGVLLMDLDAFRREGLVKRVMDYAASHRKALVCPDQDALNGALCDRLCRLHPRWNWHDGLSRHILKWNPAAALWRGNTPRHSVEAALSPGVLHYQGPHKPWRPNHRLEGPRYAAAMARAGISPEPVARGKVLREALTALVYAPLYALTRRRMRSLAVKLGAQGDF